MVRSAHHHRCPAHENAPSARRTRNQRRREHLRRIQPMTREQQLAFIEEARAARRAAQQVDEGDVAAVVMWNEPKAELAGCQRSWRGSYRLIPLWACQLVEGNVR
jgi:hypothetical protein